MTIRHLRLRERTLVWTTTGHNIMTVQFHSYPSYTHGSWHTQEKIYVRISISKYNTSAFRRVPASRKKAHG